MASEAWRAFSLITNDTSCLANRHRMWSHYMTPSCLANRHRVWCHYMSPSCVVNRHRVRSHMTPSCTANRHRVLSHYTTRSCVANTRRVWSHYFIPVKARYLLHDIINCWKIDFFTIECARCTTDLKSDASGRKTSSSLGMD